jgi:tRNA (guanine10-N2)-dimethyltransferase
MKSLYILGRQSDIGVAELESLIGSDLIKPVNKLAILSAKPADYIPFSRLGGSTRVCKLLTTLPYSDWSKVQGYLLEAAPQFVKFVPEGKLHVGVSVYGFNINPRQINASALKVKKVIRETGKSVRIVPNTANELNAAQVLRNKLTSSNGWELILLRDGNQTHLAQTVSIQDIDAYAARDQARPKRDARVGMLPPKLAQIIVNIGSHGSNYHGATLLDPFCGTGVILQEAALMGFNVYGTDIDNRMIEYTNYNIDWLTNKLNLTSFTCLAEIGDATSYRWHKNFDFIAAETYLGRPFSSTPHIEVLSEVMRDVDVIHRKFLLNVAQQTKPGFRMCIAVPAWKTNNGFKHLKVLDSLEELGYTRQSFVHAENDKLIYHREGQFVGRELVVLTRK